MNVTTHLFHTVGIQLIIKGKLNFSIRDERKKAFDYLWERLEELEYEDHDLNDNYEIQLDFY